MKKRLLAFVLVVSVPAVSMAQGNRGNGHAYGQGNGGGYTNYDNPTQVSESSTLSIFSEMGEPFFLVLNGVKQNLAPQTKIRVEALPQYINDVQLYFANNNLKPIHKKLVASDPVDGKAVSMILKVTAGRGGNPELKFHRMAGCEQNYRGPRDEYVMYYGKPQQINTTTETTYTDPATGGLVTQTTTTTTTNNYGSNTGYNTGGYNGNGNNVSLPPVRAVAMNDAAFSDAKQSVSSASFEDTKRSTAETILASNFVTTQQVIEICKLFSFEDTKLTFAKFAYSRTVDPNNYYKVASVLDFDGNKKALNTFINTGK